MSYENEVKKRWGETTSYKEHTEKTKDYTDKKWAEVNNGLMSIFLEFSKYKNQEPFDSKIIQALVIKLQAYITENYYTCTNEILLGLNV